jgi:hypothetical protein
MSKLINLSIDLTKIDKSKINNHPNGSKYYSITVELKDEADAFGNNVSAWNAQTKEERAAKANRQFIGNGKVIWENTPSQTAQPSVSYQAKPITNSPSDDGLPF